MCQSESPLRFLQAGSSLSLHFRNEQQSHSAKPELRFCGGSNPACGVSEACNGHNLWEWFCLKARLKAFHQSTILQKQFISSSSSSPNLFIRFFKYLMTGTVLTLPKIFTLPKMTWMIRFWAQNQDEIFPEILLDGRHY